MDQKQYRKAVAYYGRALEADPDYTDVHWNMAIAYRSLDMKREAAGHYRAFAELASADERNDVNTARTYLAELRREGHVFDEVVEEAPALAGAPGPVETVSPPVEEAEPVLEEEAPVSAELAAGALEEGFEVELTDPCAEEAEFVSEEDVPTLEELPLCEPEDFPEVGDEEETTGTEASSPETQYDELTEDELRERVAADLDRAEREQKMQARAEE